MEIEVLSGDKKRQFKKLILEFFNGQKKTLEKGKTKYPLCIEWIENKQSEIEEYIKYVKKHE